MTTITFLQSKLDEQVKLKADYLTRDYLLFWEENNLKETEKEIDFYIDAISTIKAFDKVTLKNLV